MKTKLEVLKINEDVIATSGCSYPDWSKVGWFVYNGNNNFGTTVGNTTFNNIQSVYDVNGKKLGDASKLVKGKHYHIDTNDTDAYECEDSSHTQESPEK